MPNAKYVTLKEAQTLLGVCYSSVTRMIRAGLLPASEQKQRMVRLSDVRKIAKQRPKPGNPNWKQKERS